MRDEADLSPASLDYATPRQRRPILAGDDWGWFQMRVGRRPCFAIGFPLMATSVPRLFDHMPPDELGLGAFMVGLCLPLGRLSPGEGR